MENLIAALAVDGKYLMSNTVRGFIQDMTARCLVVAQTLCCTLEDAYKEINRTD